MNDYFETLAISPSEIKIERLLIVFSRNMRRRNAMPGLGEHSYPVSMSV